MKENNSNSLLAVTEGSLVGKKIDDCDIIIDKINEIEARCLDRLESVEQLLNTLKREIDYIQPRDIS